MASVFLYLCCFLPALALGKDYFRAAVFEHRQFSNNTALLGHKALVEASLKMYEKVAALAAENGVDLLLYNEYGILVDFPLLRDDFRHLAENVPDPRKMKLNPCTESKSDRPILHRLSCLARNNKIYVVANMLSSDSCEEFCEAQEIGSCKVRCPPDYVHIYNTNVAFDREGYLIGRYLKRHPYFEPFDAPEDPDFATFTTEFGEFGMVVCFDSVWDESLLLAREYGIDTLLFPTFWYDDITPLNAVELQQSWALTNKVNFLAANTHTPFLGSLGSGIYSKDDGALVYTYEPDNKSKLLMANVRVRGTANVPSDSLVLVVTEDKVVPKIETGELVPEHCYDKFLGPPKDVSDYRCYTMATENYTVAKLESPSGKIKACSDGFCCSLTYAAEGTPEDFYLAAFNGLNNAEGYYHWWEETCLVVKCTPFEGKACRLISTKSETVFTQATLSAKFGAGAVVYPAVSETNARLAPIIDWHIESSVSLTSLNFKSTTNQPLVKIGMMGRRYDRDPPFVNYYQY